VSGQRADHTLLLLLQAPCSLNPDGQGCNGGGELPHALCARCPPHSSIISNKKVIEELAQPGAKRQPFFETLPAPVIVARSGPPQGKFAEQLAAFEAAKQRQAVKV
jgi:hypothetical protein